MIRIGIVGDIGSGKSYIAKLFGYPVFNADIEVAKIYKTNAECFKRLKKKLPRYFSTFPTKKSEIINAIKKNKINLKKITNIIHPQIKKKMNFFLKKNKKNKIVVLDIPLLLEKRINKKGDILIFVESNKKEVFKRLKKRDNFDLTLLNNFKEIQLSLVYKKKKSNFIIKNDFTKKTIKKSIKNILLNI